MSRQGAVNAGIPRAVSPASALKALRVCVAAVVVVLTCTEVGAETSIAMLRARAMNGGGEALNDLANAYLDGKSVEQDYGEALKLYQLAAAKGVAAASFNLGMMYEFGRGVPANVETAFQHYLRAAQQGSAPAQFNVGNMYANGTGTKADLFEAALWFKQAAERNIPEAQYNLGLAYELGRGVGKDEAAAQKWYRAAAERNFARAQYNLALMIEEGRGSDADPAEAAKLYRAAAEQNFFPAQNNLGILLAEGKGVPADVVEAYAWLAIAVVNGADAAGRDAIAKRLTPTQFSAAYDRVKKQRALLGLVDRPVATEAIPAVFSDTLGKPASPPVAIDVSRPLRAGSGLEAMREENDRLMRRVDLLARERNELQQRVADAEGRLESAKRAPINETRGRRSSGDESARLVELQGVSERLRTTETELESSRHTIETLTAEIARLRNGTPVERPVLAEDANGLLAQLESLTRELAVLRSEKAELLVRNNEFALRQTMTSGTMAGLGPPAASFPDTAGVPLQELARADRRIARVLAENSRMQELLKRVPAEGPADPARALEGPTQYADQRSYLRQRVAN